MKHTLMMGGLAVLIVVLGVFSRRVPLSSHRLEGTVLYVEDGVALVSRRVDLKAEDLRKSTEEWFFEEYGLIYVEPINDLEPGTQIRFVLDGPVSAAYPPRVTIKRYELIP